MSLAHCRVVLVRTVYPGNLGATARVMRNFGPTDLVLVAPEAKRDHPDAIRMSTHGESVLRSARIVPTLQEAIADCQLVYSTSAIVDGIFRNRSYGVIDEMLPAMAELLPVGRCALVFGPEPVGLSNDEITQCHGLIHIPTDPEYGALNLAQSVAICLYELRKIHLKEAFYKKAKVEPMPPVEFQERMFQRLQSGLEAIHFLYGVKAPLLMHGVRHMISRAKPREKEVRILLGLARQLHYVADKLKSLPPDELKHVTMEDLIEPEESAPEST